VRRSIAAVGRALVTLGLLILLFVAYQLWGTGIWTARAQTQLKHDFKKELQQYNQQGVDDPTITAPSRSSSTTLPLRGGARPAPPIPKEGDVGGIINIPAIHIRFAFVEGTSRDDLKKGPGHYPDTPFPGTIGNAAIAGHRTTYLHPFYDVDHLKPGDEIHIKTFAGEFVYKVYKTLIVSPTDVSVVDNTADAELTLTSCNPKYSAAQRIVIKARLAPAISAKPSKPRPLPPRAGNARAHSAALEEGLSGQERSKLPTVLWGIFAALLGLGWWWAFRRWRHPATWALGVIPFLIVLFPFYVFLERALPAGY
jgi:sortase A